MLWLPQVPQAALRAAITLYIPLATIRASAQVLPQAQRCYSTPLQLPTVLVQHPQTDSCNLRSSAFHKFHKEAFSDIAFDELKQKLTDKQVTLIDVRLPGEYRTDGMIPDSKNLALQWLGESILQPPKDFASQHGFSKPALDEPIVVSCLAGVRARTAQLALMGAGYTNVRVYTGSFEDWVEKGGRVDFPTEVEQDN